ncbi:hypothetical protein CROQUDRAFT_85835 [Cronartium quercuum f. sp. fusiforme G11]|uniref:Uncharacterized protein n=1 Tax=Cronartium quercuum f. sp. fusiforme G11 TaxID=708437 RepID=A0A9P6TGU0_9BASI|nr:hypothetical protein CROQUDRAFT_85835 [Cronartium quercuum f. sp. fusiforme G11]
MHHQTSTSANQVAHKSLGGSNLSLTSSKSQSNINDTDMSSDESDEEYNEEDVQEKSINNDGLVHSKASKKRHGHHNVQHTWIILLM